MLLLHNHHHLLPAIIITLYHHISTTTTTIIMQRIPFIDVMKIQGVKKGTCLVLMYAYIYMIWNIVQTNDKVSLFIVSLNVSSNLCHHLH